MAGPTPTSSPQTTSARGASSKMGPRAAPGAVTAPPPTSRRTSADAEPSARASLLPRARTRTTTPATRLARPSAPTIEDVTAGLAFPSVQRSRVQRRRASAVRCNTLLDAATVATRHSLDRVLVSRAWEHERPDLTQRVQLNRAVVVVLVPKGLPDHPVGLELDEDADRGATEIATFRADVQRGSTLRQVWRSQAEQAS